MNKSSSSVAAKSPAPLPQAAARGIPRSRTARLASVGLGAVLVVLPILALSGALLTYEAGTAAKRANELSDAYQDALYAVGAEESLERKYRLEPGKDVLERHRQAGVSWLAALDRARALSGPADRALIDKHFALHQQYLVAIGHMFAAVDAGDTARATAIDGAEVDPVFDEIESWTEAATAQHRAEAAQNMKALFDVQAGVLIATPIILLLGMGLVILFWRVLGAYRKHALEAAERETASINRSEKRFRALVYSSSDMVLISDTGGKITYQGPMAQSAWRYQTDGLMGQSIAALIHPDDQAIWQELLEQSQAAAASGQTKSAELRLRNAEGVWRYAQLILTNLLHEPAVEGLVATVRDITERRSFEEQLINERDRAIALEKTKREFLAMMSHELRTPMNGILGFTNLLLSSGLDAEQTDFAKLIRSSGETLLALLNDILDFSKIEAGALELEMEDFSLANVVSNVVTLLGPQAFAKRLDLSAYIDPSLPGKLRGDPGRLRQVLLNLVGNAIKFTESGAVAVEVRQERGDGAGRAITLSVTDTGVGIAKDQQESIFERFTQVDTSSSRKYEGTGLGLPICKELANLMGGEIHVESAPDKGSTFRVCVRLADVIPPAERIADDIPQDITDKKILVVDDNSLNRRIFKLQLEGFGAQVDCVADAHGALAALSQAAKSAKPYQLAIIDQMMPGTDGVTLRTLIAKQTELKNLKTIISSSAGIQSDAQARALGFDGACPKPVMQEKLIAKVYEVLVSPGTASAPLADAKTPIGQPQRLKDGKWRILVAEDNPSNQRLIVALLERAGYSVDVVADGVEAVHAAQVLPYDLILMDIRMPVMGGIEATKRIRSMQSPIADCPILALTANAMSGDKEEYLAAGLTDYISKPVDFDALLSKIKGYLDDRRRLPENTAASA